MTVKLLDEDGCIVLTDIHLLDTCTYSDGEVNTEYHVLVGVPRSMDSTIRAYGSMISVAVIDNLIDELTRVADTDITPPYVLSETSAIQYRDDVDGVCLVCKEQVQGHGVAFDCTRDTSEIALHISCIDSCTAALRTVWNHSSTMLTDEL